MGEKMFADIGTKPLAAARFNMLKEELGMKEWKEKIEEDAEQKKEEKKEGGDEKSSQVAKIIMIAALLDGVKAQEDEEEEPGTTEFQVMMVAFALLIVFATLAIQWLLGVFQQSSATKEISTTKKQGGGKNQKKKKEAESPKMERPKSLPEPASVGRAASSNETVAGLPTGGDAPWVGGEPAATLPPEAASGDALWVGGEPAATLPTVASEVSGGDAPWVGGEPAATLPTVTSSESSQSFTSQRGVTEERIMAIMEEIVREEEQMWADIRANPEVAAQEQQGGNVATLAFQIYTTRYGSVYHCRQQCGYLRAAQTGPRRESTWCHLCRHVAQRGRGNPPPGIPIWIAGWGGVAHTDPRCPQIGNSRETRLCTQCQMNSDN